MFINISMLCIVYLLYYNSYDNEAKLTIRKGIASKKNGKKREQ